MCEARRRFTRSGWKKVIGQQHPGHPSHTANSNKRLVIAAELDGHKLAISSITTARGYNLFHRICPTFSCSYVRVHFCLALSCAQPKCWRRWILGSTASPPLPRRATDCDDDMNQLRVTAIQTQRRPLSNAGDWLAT